MSGGFASQPATHSPKQANDQAGNHPTALLAGWLADLLARWAVCFFRPTVENGGLSEYASPDLNHGVDPPIETGYLGSEDAADELESRP